MEKICTKCKILKPLEDFYNRPNVSDGKMSHCKKCKTQHHKSWRSKNPEKLKAALKRYYRKRHPIPRHKRNPLEFHLRSNLRKRMNKALKIHLKSGSAVRDLGCSISEFRAYLESKFQPGMTWNNYGKYGWHLDHIKPLGIFDLTNREEFLKAAHYTNLRPLWAGDNLKKSKSDLELIKEKRYGNEWTPARG
jgi:hypothetical protein